MIDSFTNRIIKQEVSKTTESVDVGRDRISEEGCRYNPGNIQCLKRNYINLLKIYEEVIQFSGENLISKRIATQFSHKRHQVVIEIFSRQSETAHRGRSVVVFVLHREKNRRLTAKVRRGKSGIVARSITY